MFKNMKNSIKSFFKMITEIQLIDIIPRNYYKIGYKGKSLPNNIGNNFNAVYSFMNGKYAFDNDGVDISIGVN